MRRGLYRCLIGLHPPAFRNRFAAEMLWAFDQAAGQGTLYLFADGVFSVVRQWILRSGLWKMAASALASSLLIFGWWHLQESSLQAALGRGNPGQLAEDRHRLSPGHGTGFDRVFGTAVQAATTQSSDAWPIRSIDISPQIAAVKQRLEAGDPHTIDNFWQSVGRTGTPLIERANDSPDQVIVTFLWRGDANTRNVGLLAPLAKAPNLPSLPLHQLPDSDIWYGSWQMRDDFCFTYRLAANVKPDESPQQSAAIDPLNPHSMKVPFEGGRIPAALLSIARMPRAPEEVWISRQAGLAAGEVQELFLKSALLGDERKVWVYTPPRFCDKSPDAYRLLVLFDGFSYQNWIPAPAILDNLIHAGKIPPMVAVMIDNPPESRMSELEYNSTFAAFLSAELLPWVHRHWNVTTDPHKVIVGGYSAGGAAAAFVAMQRPDLFGNVLSQSGSFWDGHKDVKWEWMAAQSEANPKLPLRFFIEAGLLEDVAKDGPTLLAANRHLVKILRLKGYPVGYEEVAGTHEPIHWRNAFPDGLVSLTK